MEPYSLFFVKWKKIGKNPLGVRFEKVKLFQQLKSLSVNLKDDAHTQGNNNTVVLCITVVRHFGLD